MVISIWKDAIFLQACLIASRCILRALGCKSNWIIIHLLNYYYFLLFMWHKSLIPLGFAVISGQQQAVSVGLDWCTHLSSSAFPACYYLTYTRAATLPSQGLMGLTLELKCWKALFSLVYASCHISDHLAVSRSSVTLYRIQCFMLPCEWIKYA